MTGGQRVGKTARNPLGRSLTERSLPITSHAPIPLARKITWRLRAGVLRDIGRRTRLIKIHMRTRIRQSHSRKFIVRPKGFAVTLVVVHVYTSGRRRTGENTYGYDGGGGPVEKTVAAPATTGTLSRKRRLISSGQTRPDVKSLSGRYIFFPSTTCFIPWFDVYILSPRDKSPPTPAANEKYIVYTVRERR